MAAVEGGLRVRLIRDSLSATIRDALTDLGWFDSGRNHQPITFTDEPQNWDEAIAANTLALVEASEDSEEAEMGSTATIDMYTYYVDFFAENDDLGQHLSGDVRDILRGKHAAAGRTRPSFEVLDYRMATPESLFYCTIENVARDKANSYEKPWEKFWYSISFDVLDGFWD